MSARTQYLLLCVPGFVLPYGQFVPWLLEHGLDGGTFFRELFANRIGGFFAMDVLVSTVALFTFMSVEAKRVAVRARWLPVAATLLVGVSLGLPLFLYLRETTRSQLDPRLAA